MSGPWRAAAKKKGPRAARPRALACSLSPAPADGAPRASRPCLPVTPALSCKPLIQRSVGRLKRPMAEMCVKAVLSVADLERKDVNLDLIKVCVTS